MTKEQFLEALSNGPYAWPGGYPLYFVMGDGAALSFKAASREKERILTELSEPTDIEWRPMGVEIKFRILEVRGDVKRLLLPFSIFVS